MTWLIALMVVPVAATLGAGVWLELRPRYMTAGWLKGSLLANVALFGLGLAGVMLMGVQEVFAVEPAAAAATGEITLGQGLALLGIGLPTGLAAIGAALALGPIGSAAMAVIAEKPEMFGRTLIYMGLAEGIAIYGLVMSILLLGKI
jgi:V/A-type H+-transporting ATPase subunit K